MAEPMIELPLRIVMLAPPQGVAIAMQRGATGKGDLVQPAAVSAEGLVFEFGVRADLSAADKPPRLLGPFVQGPPETRFVYINSGRYAGEEHPVWGRRAKVPLKGLTRELILGRVAGERLEARIAGRSRDGGPACASVPLLAPGWTARA
jgi:hypothetical protein